MTVHKLRSALFTIVAVFLVACSSEEDVNSVKEAQDKKLKQSQSELADWAAKRSEFIKKHCNDPNVDCQKLLEEAGLKKKSREFTL